MSCADADVSPAYKLASTDGGDYPLCARHLAYTWRMITAYLDDRRIVIVAVDQHTRENNPAASLAEALPGLAIVGRRRQDKPPCCEEAASPPQMNKELRDLLDTLHTADYCTPRIRRSSR
jgi:hypothetical protein